MAKKKENTNSKKAVILPTPGYVLIKPQEAEQKTVSGIYLPDNASSEKPLQGTVLSVGDAEIKDGKKVDSPVKKNDIVIYKKWGGNEVKIEGEEYIFVKFEDILATVH